MSIEQDSVAGDILFTEWCCMASTGDSGGLPSLTPAELIDGASYWFTFARPKWKRPPNPSLSHDQPVARLTKFLDLFLAGESEFDLAGILVRKSADSREYEVELGCGVTVDAFDSTILSKTANQSISLSMDKSGGVILRSITSEDDDDYVAMRESSWEITGSGITELTESGRKGRHHPAHGNWSFHGCDIFESYHQVQANHPVHLSDGSEVFFQKGKVRVDCDERRIELDYDNNLLVIHDKNGRWEHPRPTLTGKNGEVLHVHGVEQLYGKLTVNWTVNDLKIETRNGGMIEVENILGRRGSIYFEKKKF